MKYLILLFFSLSIFQTNAQNQPFEGVMTWAFTTEIIDAREVEKYQKEIVREDYSEINEAILELEQQLNDPEMQYMLLENPTIKNNMQKRLNELKATQVSNLENKDNSIFPSSLLVYLKNDNSYTKIEGGSMAKLTGNMLYLHATQTTYFIKDGTKTFSVLNDTTQLNRHDSIISLQKTTETTTVLKYPCVKYILITNENDKISTSYIWVTNAIQNINTSSFRSLGFIDGNLHHEAFKQLNGIPLKIVVFEKGFQLSMEVSDISQSLLPDSFFTLPSNYKQAIWGF